MITAAEANKQTKENINNFATEELRYVKKMIEECIANGNYYFTCSGYLSKNVITMLKSLGYKVITGTQYNECYYTVSWKDDVFSNTYHGWEVTKGEE